MIKSCDLCIKYIEVRNKTYKYCSDCREEANLLVKREVDSKRYERIKGTDYYRQKTAKATQRYVSKEENKQKVKARILLNRAVDRGEVLARACEVAEECVGRVEAHHDDYTKPLEVHWVCKKHHTAQHQYSLSP